MDNSVCHLWGVKSSTICYQVHSFKSILCPPPPWSVKEHQHFLVSHHAPTTTFSFGVLNLHQENTQLNNRQPIVEDSILFAVGWKVTYWSRQDSFIFRQLLRASGAFRLDEEEHAQLLEGPTTLTGLEVNFLDQNIHLPCVGGLVLSICRSSSTVRLPLLLLPLVWLLLSPTILPTANDCFLSCVKRITASLV